MRYSIGLDLGGTKLAAAILDQRGRVLEYTKIPLHMSSDKTPTHTQKRVVQLMVDIVLDFRGRFPKQCEGKNFAGVGLASAGPLNVQKGILINPANFPGWKVVPIKKILEEALKKRNFDTAVFFQNDAIAAALAEGWVGSAKKMASYCLVTVGTGIGTGLIINGNPCQTHGAGSEFGHMHIRNHQSVEDIASGSGILRLAKEIGFKGQSIEELIIEQDPRYKILFKDMALALGALCYNLSIGFNLDGIFFSGGLIKIKELFFKQSIQEYQKLMKNFNPAFSCPIHIAKTKNQAGVIGAGYLPLSGRRSGDFSPENT